MSFIISAVFFLLKQKTAYDIRLSLVGSERYFKQRKYFDKMKHSNKKMPRTDAECREAVKMRDKIDLDIKKLQQTYHNKMLNVVSPCKVMKVILAEDRFHRRMLKNWSRKDKKG